MLILPAIDILDGKCVRLRQGDFQSPTVYSDSPEATARMFLSSGFPFLHVVDLDGARDGTGRNTEAIASLVAIKGISVQTGGGVRNNDDVKRLLNIGVQRIVTGSVAVKDPETVLRWISEYGPHRFTIALDLRGDTIATEGWTTDDHHSVQDLIGWYQEPGNIPILCTDIERDGMMSGPNIDLYRKLLAGFPGIELIASGGISSIDDVKLLRGAGVSATVIGKALYEGAIDLDDLRKLND